MPKQFTIEKLERYKNLKRRQEQLERWGNELKENLDKLTRQQEHQLKEKSEVDKEIASKFSELEQAPGLLNWSDVPDEVLSEKEKHYVTMEKKRLIYRAILEQFRTENPEAETLPFKELHRRLREFGVEARSVTNFFRGILDNEKLIGGTRNRAVVLEGDSGVS